MRYCVGKLEYDLRLDRIYIPREVVFGELWVNYLSENERIMIKRGKKWTFAVVKRDRGGWYLDSDGGAIRKFEGRNVRFGRHGNGTSAIKNNKKERYL